jgi:hypothetical protein
MQRKSKWAMWCVLFVAAVCLFGPSVVTYGDGGSSNDSTVAAGSDGGSSEERHNASGDDDTCGFEKGSPCMGPGLD